MVDVSRIKVGDEVDIRGIVTALGATCLHVALSWNTPVSHDKIVGHVPKPRPIAVGDTVIFKYGASRGRYSVKAIDDDSAWIKDSSGVHRTTIVDMLAHADDPS